MNSSPRLLPFAVAERPDPRRSVGERGEAIAERYLKRKGLRIRERGYRARCGEIDLVAEDGEELVFVEVKTRRTGGGNDPLEAVTARKRRRILRAAGRYLQSMGGWDRPCRFDVVAIRLHPDGREEVEHLPDAFSADR